MKTYRQKSAIFVISPITSLEHKQPAEYEYIVATSIAVFFVLGFALAQMF